MPTQVKLGDISMDVVLKDIKNVHLSVHPPTGRITISAPSRMNMETIRVFAISKIGWIKQQQKKFFSQERETPREYLDRESHYVWGRRYLLKIIEANQPPRIELEHGCLILQKRPGMKPEKMVAMVEGWYREQVKLAAATLITKWEPLIGVNVNCLFVQRMKTKWGSCNHLARSIRLNTELAKKPRESLEYVLVHELAHLREPTHNERFIAIMDQAVPKWRHHRDTLNALPLRHESWGRLPPKSKSEGSKWT